MDAVIKCHAHTLINGLYDRVFTCSDPKRICAFFLLSTVQYICQVNELIDQYGLVVVQAYMNHIQTNAEVAVRDMLRQVARDAVARTGSASLHFSDHMDDGSPISVTVSLDEKDGSAFCDFRQEYLSSLMNSDGLQIIQRFLLLL